VYRPFVRGGRYLYPAFERRRAEVYAATRKVLDAMAEAIDKK
jgi:hypothetical protein